jgi:hypothetical protein
MATQLRALVAGFKTGVAAAPVVAGRETAVPALVAT